MPFTPSHAIAILPFARTPLAPAALVIGSMAPDLPYFLPLGIQRSQTHSLSGVATIDLLVATIGFVLWVAVLRDPVLDYSPAWLRERMAPQAQWRLRGAVLTGLAVIAALLIGILSHLFLDLFTHEGGWISSVAPWTNDDIGAFSVANYIHAVVSWTAAGVIALWVRRWTRRTPRTERASVVGPRERRMTWIALCSLLLVGGSVYLAIRLQAGFSGDVSDLLGTSFIRAATVCGAIAAALVGIWYVRRARKARGAVHA